MRHAQHSRHKSKQIGSLTLRATICITKRGTHPPYGLFIITTSPVLECEQQLISSNPAIQHALVVAVRSTPFNTAANLLSASSKVQFSNPNPFTTPRTTTAFATKCATIAPPILSLPHRHSQLSSPPRHHHFPVLCGFASVTTAVLLWLLPLPPMRTRSK